LHGMPRYGNAGSHYTSIAMPNSIFIMQTNKKSDGMYGYLNIEGVNHAKIYNSNGDSWMLYGYKDIILGTHISFNDGFLLCEVGDDIKNTEFSILGRSHICGIDEQNVPIKSCYYKVNITLEPLAKSHTEIVKKYKFVGIVVGLITVIFVIILIILCIGLKNAAREAEIKLQGHVKAKDEFGTSPTGQVITVNPQQEQQKPNN